MAELLDRATAQTYASWFRALADPTRVQLVELLARHGEPMSVGEIVAAMGLAQSTVSQHLKILAEVRFVLVEPVGNARHYRINDACVACFPSAADVVMGRPGPQPDGGCVMTDITVRADDGATTPTAVLAHLPGRPRRRATPASRPPPRPGRRSTRGKLPDHRFVAVDGDGACSAGSPSRRSRPAPVYAGVVEHSVYVDPAAQGRGVGPAAAGRVDRLHRGGRDLDHPVRRLPGEHRQPRPAPAGRVPRHRHPRAGRPPPRPVARRRPHRTPQPRHHLTTLAPPVGPPCHLV